MKSLMKVMLVKGILFLMTASAAAINTNQQAFTYFTDANGNTGFVYVQRTTDPVTGVTTTNLAYSFCVQTTESACLEGSGVIPNSAFAGFLDGNFYRPQSMKVLVDTTKGGFTNNLCNAPDPFGDCSQGKAPATGGLIALTYVTHTGSIQIFTANDYEVQNLKVTVNSTTRTLQGPASVVGTVLGTNVSNKGASWGFDQVYGKGSLGAKAQKAQSQLSLDKSLAPATLRRLQRLTGMRSDGAR